MKCLLLILSRSCANNKVKDIPVFVVERRGGGYRDAVLQRRFLRREARLGGGSARGKRTGSELHKRSFMRKYPRKIQNLAAKDCRCML